MCHHAQHVVSLLLPSRLAIFPPPYKEGHAQEAEHVWYFAEKLLWNMAGHQMKRNTLHSN